MSIQKTIVFSVLLHLVFFSAALLFPTGLTKGTGNMPEERVLLVMLAADENQLLHEGVHAGRAAFAAPKVRTGKKVQKPQVIIEKKTGTVNDDATHKKTERSQRDRALEEALRSGGVTEGIKGTSHETALVDKDTGYETPPDNEDLLRDDHVRGEGEIVRAAFDQSHSESRGLVLGGEETDESPDIAALISRAIERVKTYPFIARKRGLEGTVHVSFRVGLDGRPEGIRILKSSGHPVLDKATVSVVRKAAPYPHIEQPVEVPVAYKLRKRG